MGSFEVDGITYDRPNIIHDSNGPWVARKLFEIREDHDCIGICDRGSWFMFFSEDPPEWVSRDLAHYFKVSVAVWEAL